MVAFTPALYIALLLVCLSAKATNQLAATRNTIFGEERFHGEVFQNLDVFENFNSTHQSYSPYRLPTTTRPEHYTMFLTINITDLSYSGTTDIDLYATEANVDEIILHSDHHTVTSVVLAQGTSNIPITYNLQSEGQLLKIQVMMGYLDYSNVVKTIYTLKIDFNAPLREDKQGLYKSWYRNSYDEQERWMASTQFSPTSARYAFPCYDEPAFLATFDVTIIRPTTHRSWFGTRISETINSDLVGYERDVFYRTPVMSTYVFGLIVAEYDSLEVTPNDLLMYEVIARPGAISNGQGAYALDMGQKLVTKMSNETEYDYYLQHPNLKMTQAAIPNFHFSAMENWGLLTYREVILMYDEAHTSSHHKQTITNTLAHEIAHMWYGNLVTFEWWATVWLKEGFARYYQYFLSEQVVEMGFGTRFITEQVHTALLSDSSSSPHPLTNPGIATNAEVLSMFSTISYNKGACIIRMTEHLLGSEIHRDGLRSYIKKFAVTRVTNPELLFEALYAIARQKEALTIYGSAFDFSKYYSSWTEQPGHPVLNVQVDHHSGAITIYQHRFNINTGYSAAGTNYIVPITFAIASNPDFDNTKPSHILYDAVTVINRGSIGDQWTIFNKQQSGFYRVNYDDYTWDLIIMALRSDDRTLIHEHNRAQIVNDVFSFARSGIMNYERAFNILSFLKNETSYAPWVAAVTGFTWIRNRMIGTAELDHIDQLIQLWATTIMNDLTYYPTAVEEPFMRTYLRYQLAPTMCLVGVQECVDAANDQYAALHSAAATEVAVDSRVWVYCNGLRYGTPDDFNFLWSRFQQHNVYSEKVVILSSLGCTSDPTSLNILLDNIVQDNYVIRPQDYTTAFSAAVNGNEGNTQIVFTYIQNYLQFVINAFGNAVTPLSYISARLRTIEEIESFQTWATANQGALGDDFTAVYNGAELSRESIEWAAKVQNDMNNYFTNGDQPLQTTTTAPNDITEPSTIELPDIVEPVTPDIQPLEDMATNNIISKVVLILAVIFYVIV